MSLSAGNSNNNIFLGSCTKETSNTRSSGLSTPSLNAISCHKKDSHDTCYTINLGYVSQPHGDEPAQFAPYQYHQEFLQHQPRSLIHHELSR